MNGEQTIRMNRLLAKEAILHQDRFSVALLGKYQDSTHTNQKSLWIVLQNKEGQPKYCILANGDIERIRPIHNDISGGSCDGYLATATDLTIDDIHIVEA